MLSSWTTKQKAENYQTSVWRIKQIAEKSKQIAAFLSQFHLLIAIGVQFFLLFPTVLMVIGAAKRIRCLMVPYLVVFGLAQIGLLVAVVACVLYLHKVSGQTALSLAIGKSNQVLGVKCLLFDTNSHNLKVTSMYCFLWQKSVYNQVCVPTLNQKFG